MWPPQLGTIAPQASIEQRLATSSKVDLQTRSPRQRRRLICKSKLEREANRQRSRRGAAGAAEEPSTDIGPEGGVDDPDGHASTALQGLSSISHRSSVAAAGFYRSDVINSSETSAGRAHAMMHKFALIKFLLPPWAIRHADI
ncbi:hypothetical protein THAOC_27744 [Thalassiosira oceanica]|uniref:Uncharacterized protein n=1 Tax=Thalassiosira oceanica TaxID=159749 RepID=K0RVP2_THAOC|nr:hypothetical protein THAOC_27744 [Thalassiosira oceanica]|eukprot:EJK52926.1 hypothetical protein THAOC_27744 [Thalassiosira oceanica]